TVAGFRRSMVTRKAGRCISSSPGPPTLAATTAWSRYCGTVVTPSSSCNFRSAFPRPTNRRAGTRSGSICQLGVSTQLARQTAGFIFERAETEISRAVPPVEQVFVHKLFQAPAPLALRDMHQLMEEDLAIPPAIRANDDPSPAR